MDDTEEAAALDPNELLELDRGKRREGRQFRTTLFGDVEVAVKGEEQ